MDWPINDTAIEVEDDFEYEEDILMESANENEEFSAKEADYWTHVALSGAPISEAFQSAPLAVEVEEQTLDIARLEQHDQDRNESALHKVQLEASIDFRTGRMIKQKTRKKQSHLTPEGRKLLGQANDAFLSEDYPMALEYLHSVIQECPHSHEPYHTLGVIYEDSNDLEKAILFYMVSAHLSPGNAELWRRLASLCVTAGHLKEAVYCLGKALNADPTNSVEVLQERCALYIDMGQTGKAVDGLQRLLQLNPRDLMAAQELSKILVQTDRVQEAVQVFLRTLLENQDEDIMVQPDLNDFSWQIVAQNLRSISLDDVNIMAELYMMADDYKTALEMLQAMTGVLLTDERKRKLPMDLRVKIGICEIRLQHFRKAAETLQPLERQKQQTEAFGDLYLDVAEAYMEEQRYKEALQYYLRVEDEKSWGKIAECYKALGELDKALEYLQLLEERFPNIREIKLQIAEVYDSMGFRQEAWEMRNEFHKQRKSTKRQKDATASSSAVTAKHHHHTAESHNLNSLFLPEVVRLHDNNANNQASTEREISQRFYEQKSEENRRNFEACFTSASSSSHLSITDYAKRLRELVVNFQTIDRFFGDRLRKLTTATKRSNQDNSDAESDSEALCPLDEAMTYNGLTVDEWFQVNRTYVFYLANTGKQEAISEALNILMAAMRSSAFYFNPGRMIQMRLYVIVIAKRFHQYSALYDACRWFMRYHQNSPETGNLCQLAFTGSHRMASIFANANTSKAWIRKARTNNFQNPNQLVLLAHLYAQNGFYPHAFLYYTRVLKFWPSHPLVYLCLGLSYLHKAMRRNTNNRQLQIVQGMAFINRYAQLRRQGSVVEDEEERWRLQETFYNLGSAYHMLGIYNLAMNMYRRALKCKSGHFNDLTGEIVFSMSLVYQKTGNLLAAKKLLLDYKL